MAMAKLLRSLGSYSPPDYYLQFDTSAKVDALIGNLDITCKHSVENSLGSVIISEQENVNPYEYTVVVINDDTQWYIGLIDNIRKNSANSYRITYTVDWYTSYCITNCKSNLHAPLVAHRLKYMRKWNGEFTYLDEGITPVRIKSSKQLLTIWERQLNNPKPNTSPITFITPAKTGWLMVYRESVTNTTHYIVVTLNQALDLSIGVMEIWQLYCTKLNVWVPGSSLSKDQGGFNPNGVLFWGYLNFNIGVLPLASVPYESTDDYRLYRLNDITTKTIDFPIIGEVNYFTSSTPREYTTDWFLTFDYETDIQSKTSITAKDWDFYRIIDSDGSTIYEFPRGLTYTMPKISIGFNFVETSPYLTVFFVDTEFVDTQFSFSIPIKQLSFFVDSEQVYRAEERDYQKSMRNLQTTNELVSGIVGGVNQGAMIAAFSRTQTGVGSSRGGSPQPPLQINKGVIGGGIGIVGAFAGFAYNTLYGNKEAQRIEDKRARAKADTLLLSGNYNSYADNYAGLYEIKYDDTTISNIEKYHNTYGYQTNEVGINVTLTTLGGYHQGDIMFHQIVAAPYVFGVPRTEIQRYVKEMLNYGATFIQIGISGN